MVSKYFFVVLMEMDVLISHHHNLQVSASIPAVSSMSKDASFFSYSHEIRRSKDETLRTASHQRAVRSHTVDHEAVSSNETAKYSSKNNRHQPSPEKKVCGLSSSADACVLCALPVLAAPG